MCDANQLEILLRVQQGMTFHFETITFIVTPKIIFFVYISFYFYLYLYL